MGAMNVTSSIKNSKIAANMHKLKENAEEALEQGKEKSEKIYRQKRKQAVRGYAHAKESVADLLEELDDYSHAMAKNIKSRPITSGLLVAGLGCLIAAAVMYKFNMK